MKFVITPDSYKESMDAITAAKAIESGIKSVINDAECDIVPMADGGEGTAECLTYNRYHEKVKCNVVAPLGNVINSEYIWLKEENVAIIEVAKACGIMLVPVEKRDPKIATSYGVGQLILDALNKGCKELILTLGGTAINDGGSGMLSALGAKFIDKNGENITYGCAPLINIKSIDLSKPLKLLENVKIKVLCDVKNVLLGKNGATYVYALQKGAKVDELEMLEKSMSHYSTLVEEFVDADISNIEGAGAAGGLGFALFAINKTPFISGAEYIIKSLNIEEKIKQCDFVITGEGSLDSQSLEGKVPISIGNIAQKYNKPVIVFAGKISGNINKFYENGISAVFSIINDLKPLKQVLNDGEDNLKFTAESVARILENR